MWQCGDVKLVNSEIIGHQCCHAVCPTSPFCSLELCTSLYRQTSHSGTDGPCLCKLNRVLCCAAHACVCCCLCVLLCVDLCMPMSGFSRTVWKLEERQNWTLSKQPATKLKCLSKTWYYLRDCASAKVLLIIVKCYSYISESCSVKMYLSWVL